MHIKIIAVGKLKEKYLKMAIGEYLKRLTPYARVDISEITDEPAPQNASPAEENQVREKEGERIARQIKDGTYLIALDIKGKMFSSEELAAHLAELSLTGKSDITFLIGGSIGLAPALLSRADLRLSFSPMTFPHQLMRVILLEQLYRCFKINAGEPYHK